MTIVVIVTIIAIILLIKRFSMSADEPDASTVRIIEDILHALLRQIDQAGIPQDEICGVAFYLSFTDILCIYRRNSHSDDGAARVKLSDLGYRFSITDEHYKKYLILKMIQRHPHFQHLAMSATYRWNEEDKYKIDKDEIFFRKGSSGSHFVDISNAKIDKQRVRVDGYVYDMENMYFCLTEKSVVEKRMQEKDKSKSIKTI